MRQPPQVDYLLDRCWPLAAFLVVGGLLPLAQVLLWWQSQTMSSDLRLLVGAVVVPALVWSGWAWRVWSHWPTGRLRWVPGQASPGDGGSGGCWRWRDLPTGEERDLLGVDVALDLQAHVLLRLKPVRGRALWVSASRTSDPGRWLDLRRAWTATID